MKSEKRQKKIFFFIQVLLAAGSEDWEERPDAEVVPSVGFSLMEHTNSLNGIDVSAKCLHRPLLTYLMNHFQQTTPTNNNDLSFLNIKRANIAPLHRRDTFAAAASSEPWQQNMKADENQFGNEWNEPRLSDWGPGFALSSSFRFDDDRL